MKEYAIKVGKTIIGTGCPCPYPYFHTAEGALEEIRNMELADKAYDIPNPEKRTVIFREVGKWTKWQKKK